MFHPACTCSFFRSLEVVLIVDNWTNPLTLNYLMVGFGLFMSMQVLGSSWQHWSWNSDEVGKRRGLRGEGWGVRGERREVMGRRKGTGNPKGKVRERKVLVRLYSIQWILNILWNPLFFYMHWSGLALFEIILLTILLAFITIYYWREMKWAVLLLSPYVIWLCIATSLNAYVFFYN